MSILLTDAPPKLEPEAVAPPEKYIDVSWSTICPNVE